jgi:hypothetical protein
MARQNLDQVYQSMLNGNLDQIDKGAARKSLAWFDEQTRILSGRVSPAALMTNSKRKTSILIPGSMVLFWYDAKTKDKLPYWDMLPLVIPFSRDAETFTGLNFHYLPYKMRAVLLKNLQDFATSKKLTEKSRLQFAWEYVAGISRYRGVSACVKKYRLDHLQSQFLTIPATQWWLSLLLPVEKFVTGESNYQYDKKRVFRDSMSYL